MKKNRDNFLKSVATKLERRVNGHCSNPDCGVPTSSPAFDSENAVSIGVAAHIAAASKGGPRFDKEQSVEQRKSISNAIWLCCNCSVKIDRDEKRYTGETLRGWRRQAEQKAQEEMGCVPISRGVYESLRSIVFGGGPKKSIVSAVEKLCKISSDELEKLDPRFSVNTDYVNGRSVFTLLAKQDVECQAIVAAPFCEEFLLKYRDLIDHGIALEIDSQALKLEGSPLFDLHTEDRGKIVFQPTNKKSAICKVSIIGEGNSSFLDDFRGHITGGLRSLTFTGNSFDEFFSLKIKVSFDDKEKNADVSFGHSYSFWHEKNVLKLPYFNRVYDFYQKVVESGVVNFSMEIDGDQVLGARSSNFLNMHDSRQIISILRHIRNVRGIVDFLGSDIVFRSGLKITSEEFSDAEYFYNLFVDFQHRKGRELGVISFNLQPHEPNSPDISRMISGDIVPLHLQQELVSSISVFGQSLKLPKINLSYTALRATKCIRSKDRTLELSFEPDPECRAHISILNI